MRRRFRIAASSADAVSRISPPSSTLRAILAASSGAGSSSVAHLREMRAPPGLQPRREPVRRVERLAHLEELGRGQAPAATRSLERRADVPRATDAGLGLVRKQPVGLIGLVLEEPDMRRVRDGHGRERQLAGRIERGAPGQLLDDRVELERAKRARIGRGSGDEVSDGRRVGHR